MNTRRPFRHLFLFLLALMLCGCGKLRPSEPISLDEAEQKFADILKNEFKVAAVIKKTQDTVWVYVPLQENLMQVAATPEGAQKSETSEERPAIKHLETSYANRRFLLTFDIRPETTYAQSQGYKLDYTTAYRQTSQHILTAVSQAYFETVRAPRFFVIVTADARNGVEIENILYLEDLKRYMAMESIPQEEFVKRNIYEVRGRADWIGDTEGRHLAYREITMPEFLARQITSRVNFKYQKSSFPPSNDARGEILNIVAETLKNYNFTDFNYVELRDLNAGLTETVLPAELIHKAEQPDTSGSPVGDSLRSQ